MQRGVLVVDEFMESRITQYIILIIAVIAGIAAAKLCVAPLPETGVGGAIKKVVLAV